MTEVGAILRDELLTSEVCTYSGLLVSELNRIVGHLFGLGEMVVGV